MDHFCNLVAGIFPYFCIEQMIKEYGILDNKNYVLTSDVTFSSPSTAAMFCLGRPSNGWSEWKDKNGNTLDVIYRKQLE